jgi:hypothetical protein
MSNVISIATRRNLDRSALPDRPTQLRQWFAAQALDPAGHVAAFSVAITGDGRVTTSGRGILPEDAAVILEELKEVVTRLEAIAAEDAPPQRLARHQCQVIPLRKPSRAVA